MKKTLSVLALSLALAACAPQPTNNTDNSSSTSSEQASSTVAAKRRPMEWVAVQSGTGSDGIPENELTLQVVDTDDVLFTTACSGTTSTANLESIEGSVASIQCWWAGGGDQYGVWIGDAEELQIKHRTVDEEAGFGEWEEMTTR